MPPDALSMTARSTSTGASRLRATGLAVSLASEVAIVVSLAVILTFDYGRDQSIYAVVAREMLHGAAPYRDVFDFKPPGIYFLYALARGLFGSAHWGIRALEAVSLLITVAGLIVLGERYAGSRRVGLAAGAVTCLLMAQQEFWDTAQPEDFGCALVIWAVVLALSAEEDSSSRTRFSRWAGAGMLFGASALLKPPLGGIGPMLAVLAGGRQLWLARAAQRPMAWRTVLIPALAMAFGGVMPFIATAAWFGAHGALRDLYDVLFVFTPKYTQLGWHGAGSVLFLSWATLYNWLTYHSSFVWLGLALLVVFRPSPRERLLVAALLVAILVLLAGIVMQAKMFPYHWNTTFPLTSLLAVLGMSKAVRWCGQLGRWAAPGAVALIVVLTLVPFRHSTFERNRTFAQHALLRFEALVGRADRQSTFDSLASHDPGVATQNRLAAQYLAAKLPPDAPLFVWGFEPELYDISGLPLASRYVYDVPLRAEWFKASTRPVLQQELRLHPPGAIVVEHGDRLAKVVGSKDDSAEALQGFDALQQLIASSYRFDLSVGALDVYLKR